MEKDYVHENIHDKGFYLFSSSIMMSKKTKNLDKKRQVFQYKVQTLEFLLNNIIPRIFCLILKHIKYWTNSVL